MSHFSEAIAEGMSTVLREAGVTITYRRGSQFITPQAVPQRTSFLLDDGDAVTEYQTRDYTVAVCDMYFGDTAIEPQRGDLIEETYKNQIYKYEVNRDGSEQVWRYADHGRTFMRIHSQLKSKANL